MSFRLEPSRDRKLYRMLRDAEVRSLRRGQALYEPGTPARDVFLVREGYLRLVLPGMEQGSRLRTAGLALPWEFVGFEALTRGLRRYGAVAGCSSAVQALPGGAVMRALKSARRTLDAYLEGTERELHRVRHARAGSHGPTTRQRLAEVVLDLAERAGEKVGREIRLDVRPTHQVLADLAGAHRATVTTLLNDWLYEGILRDREGVMIVVRPAALWALAGYAEAEPSGDVR